MKTSNESDIQKANVLLEQELVKLALEEEQKQEKLRIKRARQAAKKEKAILDFLKAFTGDVFWQMNLLHQFQHSSVIKENPEESNCDSRLCYLLDNGVQVVIEPLENHNYLVALQLGDDPYFSTEELKLGSEFITENRVKVLKLISKSNEGLTQRELDRGSSS